MKRFVLVFGLATCHAATQFAGEVGPRRSDVHEFYRIPVFDRCTEYGLDMSDLPRRAWEPLYMSAVQAVHTVRMNGTEMFVSCEHSPVCFEQVVRSPTLDFETTRCINTQRCCEVHVLN